MYYDSFSSPGTGQPPEDFAPFFSADVPVRYGKGQLIYLQGSTPDHLYCLLSGTVRTVILSDQGEEKLLTIYHPGSIFGEASFFDGLPRVSSATAQTECQIVRLSHGQVAVLFQQHPTLSTAMLAYLARTVRLLSGHVDTMSFQRAETRLARLLLNHPGADTTISVTHQELAAALGLSRVTVSRILETFAKAGYLALGYRSITLLDREALGKL
jgi:CRP/FNR family transcriptional regulator